VGSAINKSGPVIVSLTSNITYLPFGPIASSLGNGQIITRTYDANCRLTDLTSTALNLHYVRDANGNVTGIGSDRYSCDPLGRLIAVKDANGSVLESYTYTKTENPGLKTRVRVNFPPAMNDVCDVNTAAGHITGVDPTEADGG
jgi:YD repeat-containing protein